MGKTRAQWEDRTREDDFPSFLRPATQAITTLDFGSSGLNELVQALVGLLYCVLG